MLKVLLFAGTNISENRAKSLILLNLVPANKSVLKVNPSVIKLLGVCLYMGRIYPLLVKISMYMLGNPWSFVIHMEMNYVKFT